jgi:cytochrome P450
MMSSIWGILTYVGIIGQVPSLHPFLLGNVPLINFLTKCGIPGPVDIIVKTTEARIAAYDEEEKDGSGRGDFLGWLRTEVEKENGKMSQRDLFNHLSNNLLAGSDTTAIGLRSAFYFLIKNPRCYAKARAEIDRADAEGRLSEHISYDECLKLPYLQAVMKESLRLHPGIGFPLERYVPPEGATICGFDLPGGTIVGVNAHVVHRDRDAFGEDAEEFRPERWLEASSERLKVMEKAFFAVSDFIFRFVLVEITDPVAVRRRCTYLHWEEHQYHGDREIRSPSLEVL